jgi:hypothetical protein
MTMTILKSSVPSHGTDASKNQFNNRIAFSEGIDSKKPMLWIFKSLKFRLCVGAGKAQIVLS